MAEGKGIPDSICPILAHLVVNNGAEAITFYKMFPDDPIALERLGVLQAASGQLAEAIQTLEAARPAGKR